MHEDCVPETQHVQQELEGQHAGVPALQTEAAGGSQSNTPPMTQTKPSLFNLPTRTNGHLFSGWGANKHPTTYHALHDQTTAPPEQHVRSLDYADGFQRFVSERPCIYLETFALTPPNFKISHQEQHGRCARTTFVLAHLSSSIHSS